MPSTSSNILGATGMVGQHFVKFLQNHPWFDLKWLGASDRSAGKPYHAATAWRLSGAMPDSVAGLLVDECKPGNAPRLLFSARSEQRPGGRPPAPPPDKPSHAAPAWRLSGAMPDSVAGLLVDECKPGNAPRLLFSAMDASVATEIERAFAQAGHVVVSNSKNHRMEPDVPLLVPEVNPDHLKLVPGQQRNRGWKGQIVTNPNCSTVGLTMGLGPLKQFGITKVIVTTMQAISGAGYPGVASMDIMGNVIPFIGGEEEKMQVE